MSSFRLLLLAFTLLAAAPALARISHLELGVANIVPGYVGTAPDQRFLILRRVGRDLINRYGKTGVIYLNDVDRRGLAQAAAYMREWLDSVDAREVEVFTLPGDYGRIALPPVTTINLNNPSHEQLPRSPSEDRDVEIARRLEKIARHSRTGLRINTYFYDDMRYLGRLLSPGAKLEETGERPYPYIYPDGRTASEVFWAADEEKVYRLTVPTVASSLEEIRGCLGVLEGLIRPPKID